MRAGRSVRRLVIPVALLTVVSSMVASAAAATPSPAFVRSAQSPSWVDAFRAAAVFPATQLRSAGPTTSDLPSSTVRRAVTLTPDRAAAQAAKAAARAKAARAAEAKTAAAKTAAAKAAAQLAQRSTVRLAAPGRSTSVRQAIAAIPGYGSHRPANWIVTGRYGHLGATDLASNNIYLSPSIPTSKLDSVVRHEWSHILSVRAYGGSYGAMMAATNRVFGGSGMTGAERAADCMAIQLGATWTHYTPCQNASWRAAAARLLAGERL